MVFTVEPVGLDVLINDARRDLELGRRLEQQRHAATDAAAVIDVLFRIRPDRIDEAAEVRPIGDRAECDGAGQRYVDRALERITDVAALEDADPAFDRAFDPVDVGLIGDVANGAADTARPEQRPLRPAQGLDPVEVVQIEVGSEQRDGRHRFIEVRADLFLHARLIAGDLAGGDTADRHLALARPEVLNREAGNVAAEVFERLRVSALDILLGLRVDRERNVLDPA